jgi:hypothetical protein
MTLCSILLSLFLNMPWEGTYKPLGSFKDNQTSLKRAIEYLQKYENS